MTGLETILTGCVFGLELMLGVFILCFQYPVREKGWLYFGAMFAAVLVVSALFMGGWQWSDTAQGSVLSLRAMLLNLPVRAVILLLVLAAIWLTYEVSFWDAFFALSIVFVFQKLEYSLYMILKGLTTLQDATTLQGDSLLFYADFGINVALFVLCTLAFRFLLERADRTIHIRPQSRVLVVVLLLLIFLSDGLNMYLWATDPYSNEGGTMIALRAFSILFYAVSMTLLYSLLDTMDLKEENAALKALSRQRESQLAFSKEVVESVNIKSHDLKKQLRYLRGDGADHQETSAQLADELEAVISDYETVLETGNEALSAVLTEKSLLCRKDSIALTCMAYGPALSFMSELDVYTLFANLLDNAIEATSKLPESDRAIDLSIRRQGEFVVIREENTSGMQAEFADGLPKTTKEDALSHGFGTKSILRIVESYGGTVSMKQTEDRFLVNILIPAAKV